MTAADPAAQDRIDMARLTSGEDGALNDLMARHGEKLFNYLLRQLDNYSDASDLAQETFVRVYQSRVRYNPSQSFSTWLFTIATNLVRDRFRWRSRHPQVSLDAEVEGFNPKESLPDPSASPVDQLDAAERAKQVREAVQMLPEELRTPLILSEYQGLAHAEIAAVLNCTAKAVETRLYRARGQLRAKLSKWLNA